MISNYREEETPVPIPNTAVKLFLADDSPRATVCESRALLILIKDPVRETCRGLLFFMGCYFAPASLPAEVIKAATLVVSHTMLRIRCIE